MSDCAKCLKSIKGVKVKLSCVDCKSAFHGKCVNMSAEDVSFLTSEGEVWRCEPCSRSRRKSMVLESKSEVSFDDIFNLVNGLRDDLKRVETNLGSSLNACHEELGETKALLCKQSEELATLTKIIEDLKVENCNLRKQVASLGSRLDDAEQYSRRNTVEIHGIPAEKGENVATLVKTVGQALGYPVDDGMVDACHRLRGRDGSGRPPGIIVKMLRRGDAEALLQKRRVKRNLTTHDLGLTSRPAQSVYVNESLAPGRRKLLHAASQIRKEKGYKYLWIRGGKILMRKDEGERVRVVVSTDDLASL